MAPDSQVCVFLLWHTHEIEEDNEDIKLLGVYSTEENAKRATEFFSEKPGFVEHPEGFEISRYVVNKNHWVDGFATVKG